MKNKKGFTLTELLAVIVIMAILSIGAISAYTTMTNNSKKKAYESKVSEIENAAIKYAKESNLNTGTTISVNKLVVQGYIQPDDSTINGLSSINNPKNNENMICNLINITISDDSYNAKYLEKNKNCDIAEQELTDSEIKVTARVLTGNSIGDNIPIIGNTTKWTGTDVVLITSSDKYIDFVSVSYDYDGQTIVKQKNTPASNNVYTETDYNKMAIKGVTVMLNSEVTVTYNMADGTTHSRTIIVRIDKEAPTARYAISNDVTTGSTKKVSLFLDDANGSGVKGFYVSQDKTFPDGTPFINNRTNQNNTSPEAGSFAGYNSHFYGARATYYVKVVDEVGNSYITPPIIISNFETEFKSCNLTVKGLNGTTWNASEKWYNKTIRISGKSNDPVGTMGIKYILDSFTSVPEERKLTKFFDGISNGGILSDYKDQTSEIFLKKFYMAMKGQLRDEEITYCVKELGVDWHEPTIDIACDSDDCDIYKKTHTIKITLKDDRSGFYDAAKSIKIGWSTSGTTAPSNWLSISGGTKSNYKNAARETITDGQIVFTTDLKGYDIDNPLTGEYYLWVQGASFEDKAHNKTSNKASSFKIKYDNTAPTCTNKGGDPEWRNYDITIIGECKDSHSGCKKYDNSGSYNDDGDVSKTYTSNKDSSSERPGRVYDNAENFTDCENDRHVHIDKNLPEVTTITITSNDNTYHTLNGKVSLTVKDTGGSGLKEICVQKDSNKNNCDWKSNTSTTKDYNNYSLGSAYDGSTITVYAWVRDEAKNESPVKSESYKVYKNCTDKVNNGSSSCGTYSGCTNVCGNGTEYATKTQPKKDQHTGVTCDAEVTPKGCSQACGGKEVDHNNCTDWDWTTCSANCGGGTNKEKRTCNMRSSYDHKTTCNGTKTEYRNENHACNTQSCSTTYWDCRQGTEIHSTKTAQQNVNVVGYLGTYEAFEVTKTEGNFRYGCAHNVCGWVYICCLDPNNSRTYCENGIGCTCNG